LILLDIQTFISNIEKYIQSFK